MSESTHTAIPDTSDTTYWIATQNEQDRSVSFVPRDKELHRELKQKARKSSQSAPTYKSRNKKD
ncbi:hypothetical protein GCM10028807_51870 [Spirosoma daeguense]